MFPTSLSDYLIQSFKYFVKDLKKANSEAVRESDSTGYKTKSQEKGFTWPTTIQEFGYEFRGT